MCLIPWSGPLLSPVVQESQRGRFNRDGKPALLEAPGHGKTSNRYDTMLLHRARWIRVRLDRPSTLPTSRTNPSQYDVSRDIINQGPNVRSDEAVLAR